MENQTFEADEQRESSDKCHVGVEKKDDGICCVIQTTAVMGNIEVPNRMGSYEIRERLDDTQIMQEAKPTSESNVRVRWGCNGNRVTLVKEVPRSFLSEENGHKQEQSLPAGFVGRLNEGFATTPDDQINSMPLKGLPFIISSNMRGDDVETHFLTPEDADSLPPRPKHRPFNDEEDEIHPGHCGLGSCHPGPLQKCKNMACFTAAYSVTGMVTSALSAYITSQITALERQFNFSSSVSGFIMSCNDLGYLLTTLIFSYYARRIHIPRALAISTLVYGISGIVCTMAYFGSMDQLPRPPPVQKGPRLKVPPKAPTQMCSVDGPFWNVSDFENETMTSTCGGNKMATNDISDSWRKAAIVTIAIGMMIQGVGKSPRHSFVGTYVDDNIPKTKTTLFLGIISGLSIFGPVLAFVVGGIFSNSYVTLEATSMSRRDPRWIGAWWLGFLVFGAIGLVAGIPLLFFPRHLHSKSALEAAKTAKEKQSEKHSKLKMEIKGFLTTVLRLATNPVYVLLNLGAGVYLLSISGTLSFTPKYFEVHFTIPAWKANLLLGSVTVLSACLGSVIGGCAASRFRFGPVNCLRLTIVMLIMTMAAQVIGILLKCDQPDIKKGINNNTGQPGTCMSTCHCDEIEFFPTCGADNVNYFSPCHAGCLHYKGIEGFVNCTCLSNNATTATAGLCAGDCGHTLVIYVMMSFVFGLTSSFIIMPMFIVNVRSVRDSDKPLALGISAFSGTLIGWFPGPVLFGAIVDSTCLIWRESECGEKGACLLYDIAAFRNYFHSTIIAIRGFFVLVLIIVYIYVTCTKRFTFQPHEDVHEIVTVANRDWNESTDRNGIHLTVNGSTDIKR